MLQKMLVELSAARQLWRVTIRLKTRPTLGRRPQVKLKSYTILYAKLYLWRFGARERILTVGGNMKTRKS